MDPMGISVLSCSIHFSCSTEDFRAVWQLTSMSLGVGVFAIPLEPWHPWNQKSRGSWWGRVWPCPLKLLSSDSVAQVLFQCAGRPSRRDFGCGRWTQSQMNWELHLLWMLAILDVVWQVAVQCLQYVFLKGPLAKAIATNPWHLGEHCFYQSTFFFTASAPQSPGPFAYLPMSPQPEMASFHGWTRLNETSFLLKVQKSSGFQKCIGNYSKAFGVPLDDNNLQSFAEEMCKCCLREADDVMFDDNQGPLAAALQEVQHYKQKLIECNLTAMKQIAAMRDGCHLSEFLQEDAVTFHEPLTYMDEHQQRLVIAVVCDKVRQLQSGIAPPSLVEALTRYAEELLRQEEGATAPMDDLLEVQSGLQKVRVQKKAVQARLEHAESESTNLRKELEDRTRAKHIKTRFCMCCMMLHVLFLFCKTKCWWWFCLNKKDIRYMLKCVFPMFSAGGEE